MRRGVDTVRDGALVLFFREPRLGAVKTRLSRAVGDTLALELYESFLRDIDKTARGVDADLYHAVDDPERVRRPRIFGTAGSARTIMGEPRRFPQKGSDLGSRMHNAFADVFARGHRHVILVGSDIPDLPAWVLEKGFSRLRGARADPFTGPRTAAGGDFLRENPGNGPGRGTRAGCVIGPSRDGGYYLIGFARGSLRRAFFRGIEWGTARVRERTLSRLGRRGIHPALLPEWEDIDEPDDLLRYYERNRESRRFPRTLALVERCLPALEKARRVAEARGEGE
jgi:hypothetical protein